MELEYLSSVYTQTKYAVVKKRYEHIRQRLTDDIHRSDEKVVYWAIVCQCMFSNETEMVERKYWAEDKKKYLDLIILIRKQFNASVCLLEKSLCETIRISKMEKDEKRDEWNFKHVDLSAETMNDHLQSLYKKGRYTEYCILYLVIHHKCKQYDFMVTDNRENIQYNKMVLHRVNHKKVYLCYQKQQTTITDPQFLYAVKTFPNVLKIMPNEFKSFTYNNYTIHDYHKRLTMGDFVNPFNFIS